MEKIQSCGKFFKLRQGKIVDEMEEWAKASVQGALLNF